jgi:sodium transport system permease protein
MSPIWWVFRKEAKEMLRDKRTRGAAFFGPIFMMIFFVCGFGAIIESLGKKESYKVHYVKTDNEKLQLIKDLGWTMVEIPTAQEGEKLVKDGKALIVLNFGPKPTTNSQRQIIEVYFDPKAQKAQIALSQIEKKVSEANKVALNFLLMARSIPEAMAEPNKIEQKKVQIGEKGAGEFIVGLLPYLFVMWAFYGGFSLAGDLVAGEKEKQTLETLLISPVTRTQIVLGKFLSLASLCFISAVVSLLGLVIVSVLKLPGSSFMLKDGLGLTPTMILATIAVLIPTVAMFASLLMAFSTYAKNTREAQSYIGLASFVVVMPAAFSQLIGLTDAGSQGWVNFTPILNTANNIRNALLGKTDWAGIGITIVISSLIAAVLLATVIKLFNREQVLTRV